MARPLVEAWVIGWSENTEEYAASVEKLCNVPTRVLRLYNHETVALNRALNLCQSPYCWQLFSDDTIIYPETPHIMAEWMQSHPKVAVMCPNREGEPRYTPYREPYRKYLADNTAMLVRVLSGLRFDESFEFTGWSDLDFGLQAEWFGYEVHVETRVSMVKAHTAYGSWSSYRRAVGARNRLLLEAKWYWIGRAHWQGLTHYNESQANIGQHIPTIYELCCWSNDELDAFCNSVDHEHPIIRLQNGHNPGNREWAWPISR